MATKVDKGDSNNTSINVSGNGPQKPSYTNGTSARKYLATDSTAFRDDDVSSISNDEHIIRQATTMRSLSMVAAQSAALARGNLQAVRDVLKNVGGAPQGNVRPLPVNYTQQDVQNGQNQHAKDILQAIPQSGNAKVKEVARNVVSKASDHVLTRKDQGVPNSSFNTLVPDINSVRVDVNKKKGTIDCFYARLIFSLPSAAMRNGTVKAFRIFRSEFLSSSTVKPIPSLSIHGIDRLIPDKSRSRIKNHDAFGPIQRNLEDSGIDNTLTNLLAIDPITGLRKSAMSSSVSLDIPVLANTPVNLDSNVADLAPFLDPNIFSGLDRSVINDLKTLRNIQIQNPDFSTPQDMKAIPETNTVPDDPQLLSPIHRRTLAEPDGGPFTISKNNNAQFKEIGFISPDKVRSQTIGDLTQFTFEDDSISFGRSYKYFVVTVDNNINESVRSRIVAVTVDGLRIPDAPDSVHITSADPRIISIVMSSIDQLTEKYEIYRREEDVGTARMLSKEFSSISSPGGFTSENTSAKVLTNGFIQIGEALNVIGRGGANFFDRNIKVGRTYTYRVYCVDIFGNKSAQATETTIYVPDPNQKFVSLLDPTITAEVDSATFNMKVTFSDEDPRVTAFFIKRRDLTLGQKAFTVPYDVNFIKLGRSNHLRGRARFEDPRIFDTIRNQSTWNGYFPNTASVNVFLDRSVEFDHTYQYQIYGIDRFGNRTSLKQTDPVMVVNTAMLEEPKNLSFTISAGPGFTIAGVNLTWTDPNVDVQAEDRVGNRLALERSGVRTLYQVQRKMLGQTGWDEFPLVEGTSFFDPTKDQAGNTSLTSRPPYIDVGGVYLYRVAAVQSGGFISNYTPQIQVLVNIPQTAPANFAIRSPDPKTQPFYVMLNWDVTDDCGPVDHWEIQRADINNAATAKLNLRDPQVLSNLTFNPLTNVNTESSRFSARTADAGAPQKTTPTSLVIGDHHYMDPSITLGNTYVYRIRSYGVNGDASDWSYRGVKITDDVFEKVQGNVQTTAFRENASQILKPVIPATYVVRPPPPSTFGMSPPSVSTTTNTVSILAPPIQPAAGASSAITIAGRLSSAVTNVLRFFHL